MRQSRLCRREQEFFVRAIREQLDLTSHLEVSLASLSIVLAADPSHAEPDSRSISLAVNSPLHPSGA